MQEVETALEELSGRNSRLLRGTTVSQDISPKFRFSNSFGSLFLASSSPRHLACALGESHSLCFNCSKRREVGVSSCFNGKAKCTDWE